MATERVTLYRVDDDKTTVIEQLPKTVASQVYDEENERFLDETLSILASQQTNIVELNDTVTSTSTTQGATANAVRQAYDRAEEAFTQANDIKTKWASVVGSPLVSTDTQAQLQTKTQTIKNTLATNLTTKGTTANGTETLTSLVDKVANVSTRPKTATGVVRSSTTNLQFTTGGGSSIQSYFATITNIGFTPTKVVLSKAVNAELLYLITYDATRGSLSSYITQNTFRLTSTEAERSYTYMASGQNVSLTAESILIPTLQQNTEFDYYIEGY